ncbi:MAG: hypothetical protein Athens041674_266 [Parcubacteria group bacterium Athens0416_74]|nr:MAG: hypothetical protein Athens041674_266 [Parcubacteria group bacterium Athens0416_74]
MNISLNSIKIGLIISALVLMFSSAALGSVSAQTQDDSLKSTIRAAIQADPRSQGMTEAEIDAMVQALTHQAQSVGMTSEDIVWRPTGEGAAGGDAPLCDGVLCGLNYAFGLDGSNYTIPIWLGACALMLMFIIAGILEYRHLHHKKAEEGQGAVPQSTGDGAQL